MIFGSQKCVFPKCTFSVPQLSWRGLVWYLLNSYKACAPRGLDKCINIGIEQNQDEGIYHIWRKKKKKMYIYLKVYNISSNILNVTCKIVKKIKIEFFRNLFEKNLGFHDISSTYLIVINITINDVQCIFTGRRILITFSILDHFFGRCFND